MYQLIENFINDAKEMDDDIFPFMVNKYPKANQVLDLVFFLGCSPTITDKMIDYISKVASEYVSD